MANKLLGKLGTRWREEMREDKTEGDKSKHIGEGREWNDLFSQDNKLEENANG